MIHRLATNYAKNYCNWTPIVKVIVENVVTCFLGGHSVHAMAEFQEYVTAEQITANNVFQIYYKIQKLMKTNDEEHTPYAQGNTTRPKQGLTCAYESFIYGGSRKCTKVILVFSKSDK